MKYVDMNLIVPHRIADESYSPVYGARPVKRYIQKKGATIAVDADESGLIFKAGKVD
jgi:hypothetical protein